MLHFFDSSPSGPDEQYARLGPPLALHRAGIPSVVWAEDALSIVHRVPTVLFDQQLLVPNDRLYAAAKTICDSLPYTVSRYDKETRWVDSPRRNPATPHAFNLNKSTLLLVHTDREAAYQVGKPERILLHCASIFHFDLGDPTRTMLNPEPPAPEISAIRFPTLPAFLDALLDTYFEPHIPLSHQRLTAHLDVCLNYLSLYTVSEKGNKFISDEHGYSSEAPILLPTIMATLGEVKEENRTKLIRMFLGKRLPFGEDHWEWNSFKEARLTRLGVPFTPHPGILAPLSKRWLRPVLPKEPRTTPYLIRTANNQFTLRWGCFAASAAIVQAMCR